MPSCFPFRPDGYLFFPNPGKPPEQILTAENFTPPNNEESLLSEVGAQNFRPAFFFLKSRGSVFASCSQSIPQVSARFTFFISSFVAGDGRGPIFFEEPFFGAFSSSL